MDKYSIRANKKFGQNFLIDDSILEKIVEVSQIKEDELIIEIGPGLGNLTHYILEKSKYLLLIEIDKNMENIIKDRFTDPTCYEFISKDILQISLDEEINRIEKEQGRKFSAVKVVANLPYYITTPIIFKLLQDDNRINEIIVMVQKEVAKRMNAVPKNKDYGILTLLVEYMSSSNIEIDVPREAFIPVPKVDSAVIKLVKCKKYNCNSEKLLFELIRASFAQRRKKVINSLESKHFMDFNKKQLEEVLRDLDLDVNSRAEEIDLDTYIKMVGLMEAKKLATINS